MQIKTTMRCHFTLLRMANIKKSTGDIPVVQWLEHCIFTAKGPGSIPGWGTKISQVTQHGGKSYKKQMLERMWRKGNPPTLLVGM